MPESEHVFESEHHPALQAVVQQAAADPPAGMTSIDWAALIAKLLPIIIQVVQIFLGGSTPSPAPAPAPKPLP